ncbi:37S ribosomal protein S23 mitochondrial [Tulasnella sp. 408]|nr:37S ribosomal protein S23 mitochondrial [Tulasnella sp. 408]
MSALLRLRTPLLALGQTPGASTSSSITRGFHASTALLAGGKKGTTKAGKKPAGGKKAQKIGGKNNKRQVKESTGPKRAEAHSVIKVEHPLFQSNVGERKLPAYTPADLTGDVVGKALAFSTGANSPIHTFGMPQTMKKEFLHSGQAFSIVRSSTLNLLDELDQLAGPPAVEGKPSQKSTNRLVLTGPSGCGKSMLLLQAVNYCAQNDWILYYVPHGIDWVNATSPYGFDYRSQLFHQHALASDALAKMLRVNGTKIAKLQLSEDIPVPGGKPGTVLTAGTSLETLAQHGVKDPLLAPQTLVLLMEELGKQTRYPVLFAVDDFQALYNKSVYRDPQFKPVSSYHLSMPRLILEYASGKRQLARGALLGALSSTNTTYPVIEPLREALGLPLEGGVTVSPYGKQQNSYKEFTAGLRSITVPQQFSMAEAAAFLEVWSANRAFHSALNDTFLLSKYTETSGNPRELLKKGILSTLQTF